MKNIVKYALSIVPLAGSMVAVQATEVGIVNQSGMPVYVALVTTKNRSLDKKIEKVKDKVFAKVLGTIDAPMLLSNNAYIIVDNLDYPPTTLGVTNYNRSLWVTATPKSLHTALSKPKGMGESDVQGNAFNLGSNTMVTIGKKGNKFTAAVSKKQPDVNNITANANAAQEINELEAK